MICRHFLIGMLFLIGWSVGGSATSGKGPVFTDPAHARCRLCCARRVRGTIDYDGGQKIGIQIIAQGGGEFAAVSYAGVCPVAMTLSSSLSAPKAS